MDNKEIATTEDPVHLVVYTDGGARPNPGRAGWGFHGYTFNLNAEVKKPIVVGQVTVTNNGYIPSNTLSKNDKAIVPTTYIDGYGSFAEDTSNNLAELTSASTALQLAKDIKATNVLIKADSSYVLEGLDKWVPNWKKNNWLKRDGTAPANVVHWKKMEGIYTELKQNGVKIDLQWVKGHDNIFGNELADKLATIGVMASREGKVINCIDTEQSNKYWKYDYETHPLLNLPRMYFNTDTSSHLQGVYRLGYHGTDDELLGKRIPDATYAIVRLKQPDPVLELVIDHVGKISRGNNYIVIGRLDKLHSSAVHKRISQYGSLVLAQRNIYNTDLYFEDYEGNSEEPLIKTLTRTKIANRAIDAITDIDSLLTKFLSKSDELVVNDFTSIIYDTVDKVGKNKSVTTETKIKTEYAVGHRSITIPVNYKTNDGVKNVPLCVTLNIDMPDRNTLKQIEKFKPRLNLITWYESEIAFRYAVIIELEDGSIGIWCSYYSNLRIV